MSYYKIRSYAKINLALNVIGKSSSLHRIESLVSFLDLNDEIYIKKTKSKNHEIKFIGRFADGINSKNTISTLLKVIDTEKLLKKNKFRIIIKKNIPSKSGLGGGSMNAASILKFLIQRKFIKISNKKTKIISSLIGSDVILGMYARNLVLKSDNTIKVLDNKKKIYVLVVKPNFGCSTKKIYSKVKNYKKRQFKRISKKIFSFENLKKMNNDLELIVLNKNHNLNILKKFLENLSGVEFARMTGSGSAIIAYFKTSKMCKEGEKKVKKQFRNYWCKSSITI